MPRQALIIVDVQNDFLPGGPLAVSYGDHVIPVANKLAAQFDLVVATRDWHPEDHGSFVTQHSGHAPGDVVTLNGLSQTLWPVHCVAHSPGAAFPDRLDTQAIDHVINKGTDPGVDSYSGFFDNGGRHDTGLDAWLKGHEVKVVYILGLATDVCVRATALDAAKLGYQTFVVEDGVRAVNLQDGDGERALEELRVAGVRITSSGMIACWA